LSQINPGADDDDVIEMGVNVNNNKSDIPGDSDALNPVDIQIINGRIYRGKYALLIGSGVRAGDWLVDIKFYGNSVDDFSIDMGDLTGITHAILLSNNKAIAALDSSSLAI
jgi:hypothetical protein